MSKMGAGVLGNPIIFLVFLAPLMTQCNDSSFTNNARSKTLDTTSEQPAQKGTVPPPAEEEPDPLAEPAPTLVPEQVLSSTTQKVSYTHAVPPNAVDYLFILDNSCSARPLRTGAQEGYSALALIDGILPGDPKIATMTTSHGAFDDLSAPGFKLVDYGQIVFEPGFLDFYHKAARDLFLEKRPESAAKYPLAGCQDRWFAPTDKDENGELCIKAAFQSENSCTQTEAGLLAFQQLLEKNKGKPIFRSGAIVNVIFVSDTHGPGIVGADADLLRSHHLSPEALKTQVLKDNNIAGFKVHAIAPQGGNQCSSEQFGSGIYNDLAAYFGGKVVHCGGEVDYEGFMKDMVTISKVADFAVYKLDTKAKKIIEVSLDGVPTEDYVFDPVANTITFPNIAPGSSVEVDIVYEQ